MVELVVDDSVKERLPDFDSDCRYYGHLDICGKLYRIPRASIGPKGVALLSAVDALKGADDNEQVAKFVALYELAMSRFYLPETYQTEIDNVGFSDIAKIIDIITCADEPQKKSSEASA